MRFAQAEKRVAFFIHGLISKSSMLTRWYFALLSGVLQPLPDCKFKRQILNSLLSSRWPECDLPPKHVTLGAKTTVALYPHLGEVGFESLLCRNELYEKEVFFCLEPRLADYDSIIEIG